MQDHDKHIKAKYDAYLHDWIDSVSVIGSLAVILLIPLDYLVIPSNFKTFLVYRITTSFCLLILYALNRRRVNETYQSALSVIGGVTVSTMVALMIHDLQGYKSPYFAGMILVEIFSIGLIPLRFPVSLLLSLVIYLIYLCPILIYDTITDKSFFISSNILMISCISSLLVLRYISQKRLMKEFALQYQVGKNEEELRKLSIIDELTGLNNRRGFSILAKQHIKIADRLKENLVLIFADMDDMKMINDTFGHQEGDRALIDMANILRGSTRASDIVARWGGDEFVVLILETAEGGAEIVCAKLQEKLNAHTIEGTRPFKLSISFGLTRYNPGNPCTLEELLERGDRLMYEHKRSKSGRDDLS